MLIFIYQALMCLILQQANLLLIFALLNTKSKIIIFKNLCLITNIKHTLI